MNLMRGLHSVYDPQSNELIEAAMEAMDLEGADY